MARLSEHTHTGNLQVGIIILVLTCVPCTLLPADEAVAATFLTPASHASSADYVWAVAVAAETIAAPSTAGAATTQGSKSSVEGEKALASSAHHGMEEDGDGAQALCRDKSVWRCVQHHLAA